MWTTEKCLEKQDQGDKVYIEYKIGNNGSLLPPHNILTNTPT